MYISFVANELTDCDEIFIFIPMTLSLYRLLTYCKEQLVKLVAHGEYMHLRNLPSNFLYNCVLGLTPYCNK